MNHWVMPDSAFLDRQSRRVNRQGLVPGGGSRSFGCAIPLIVNGTPGDVYVRIVNITVTVTSHA